MTARHQIRVGGRRLGRDRGGPIDALPAPPLGEMLRAAREHKGVDIYRAERDTKIRAKHLEALENSDYGSLPGAVYTKGFLRNYASYLGLDPDDVIERWRAETTIRERNEAVAVAPPRPIAEPNRGLTFSRGILVAAVLTLFVLGFAGYIVIQILRFQSISAPLIDGALVTTLAADAETHILSGTTTIQAGEITISGPESFTGTAIANAAGVWSVQVPVTKGENDFDVWVTDPVTKQDSPKIRVILNVPLPATPSPSTPPTGPPGSTASAVPTPTAVGTVNLTVTSPADGASVLEGSVTVAGTTDGTSVTITATLAGPPVVAPSPDASPSAEPSATPSPEPTVTDSPTPAPSVAPVTVAVTGGVFSQTIDLTPGHWLISVTASASGHPDAVVTRGIDITFDGVVVVVDVRGGDTWIYGVEDGVKAHNTGHLFHAGDTVVLRGHDSVEVDTDNAEWTYFTVNGDSLGTLGSGSEKWDFVKGQPPQKL